MMIWFIFGMIDRGPAVPYHPHDLNIKATDFALHPPVSLIQASYAG